MKIPTSSLEIVTITIPNLDGLTKLNKIVWKKKHERWEEKEGRKKGGREGERRAGGDKGNGMVREGKGDNEIHSPYLQGSKAGFSLTQGRRKHQRLNPKN